MIEVDEKILRWSVSDTISLGLKMDRQFSSLLKCLKKFHNIANKRCCKVDINYSYSRLTKAGLAKKKIFSIFKTLIRNQVQEKHVNAIIGLWVYGESLNYSSVASMLGKDVKSPAKHQSNYRELEFKSKKKRF